MALPVYSKLLFAGYPTAAESIYTVPAGYATIVSDVVLFCAGTYYDQINGLYITALPENAMIYGVFSIYARANKFFHWRGHQVLEPGAGLYCSHPDPVGLWSVRISGYELTLP